jgi:RNA-directed DNA polymerase
MVVRGGGAPVIVGARESRAHGEGGQGVGKASKSEERSVDSDHQVSRAWLLSVQRKLYQWSREHPNEQYHDLWNWVTSPENLWCAWDRVATNKGKRTPGIDGVTMGSIRRGRGESTFLTELGQELRENRYRPSPCRRKMIPKPGKPGEFRPLGIPTIKDRVVQCAVKQVLEPIFEAQFWHVSYGFRPGRGCHGALEHIRMTIRPRAKAEDGKRRSTPYQWVIEGDIKGCFDNIDHHLLMQRVRKRVGDGKVNRLLVQFLKAGVLKEDQFIRTPAGTPQGAIISPLLANIALSAIEERYERWAHHLTKIRQHRKADGVQAAGYSRRSDRCAGRAVFFPIRYADDFVVLVSGSHQDALAEKDALARYLRESLRLELSSEKTRVTSLMDGFEFLGHRIRIRWDSQFGYTPRLEVPKEKIVSLRRRVKKLTGRNRILLSLSRLLEDLNPILRGWGYFYRFCTNAKRVLVQLDWYVGDRLWRWMRKKYPKANAHWIAGHRKLSDIGKRKVWKTDQLEQFLVGRIPVRRYRRGWMGTPDYAITPGEPDA